MTYMLEFISPVEFSSFLLNLPPSLPIPTSTAAAGADSQLSPTLNLFRCPLLTIKLGNSKLSWYPLRQMRHLFVLLNALVFIFKCPTFCLSSVVDSKVLNVGVELWRETLRLRMGSRLYHLQGLKPDTWYEVKISYPGSIPASFSLELKRDLTSSVEMQNRKLLDTEKLIFKTQSLNLQGDQVDVHVLVTVKSEGVVAIPSVQERESIIYNIVCDELLIGIPHKAWGVGVLAIICLILAFIIPSLLPSWLLHTNQIQGPGNRQTSKSS